jgi:hypothetical protein
MSDTKIKQMIKALQPAFETAMDPFCVIDDKCGVVYMNRPMKALLSVKPRQLQANMHFCKFIALSACSESCKVERIVSHEEPLRLDESPAVLNTRKIRILLRGMPLYEEGSRSGKPIGAIISMRNTTGEILVQAKYHKLGLILEEKDIRISELETQVKNLQLTLKKAAISRISE